ncbi:MAG: PKD domain-containing protein, partial [bacterium]|nr:PKD domain-containing protein [bacterium]
VVLDNTSVPLEGVTARVKGTALTAVSDAEGQFHIDSAPVGSVKLIVDGSTVSRPGSWPDLEFNLVTIAGRSNTVNMPIYLLPLDLANGLYVDETEGGTLTLPQVPGLALDVAPGSVTFPGGSRSGLVSVTVVHSDRVPMVPNFGQQPRLIVTIQPAGARFEPPARLTLPNVERLAPGEVTEMYSFDHDLGHFVSIGPATTSDDGMVMRSDPGVGIVKAGWHCGGNPASSGTPNACPVCQPCNGSICDPSSPGEGRASKAVGRVKTGCDDGDACTANDRCKAGDCRGDRKRILSVEIAADDIVAARQPFNFFSAQVEDENCPSSEQDYLWDFGDGTMSTEAAPAHGYTFPGVYEVTAKVSCRGCPSAAYTDTALVKVIDILVLSADVTAGADGEIDVFLAPDGTIGTLTLELLHPDSHTLLLQDRPSGRYIEVFNIPGLAAGEYMQVRGTWEVEGISVTDQLGYHILVLGLWRHSQYNTPQDGQCGGLPVQSYVTFNNAGGASPCFNNPPGNFQNILLPQQFVDQVNLNGSGNIGGVGDVQVDVFCPNTAAAPANAPGHTFRNQAIVPSCGANLGAATVAGCLNDTRIGCGDQIFVHGVATKTVTDNCPACCTNGRQFDNYTLNGACQGIGDLGNFMTIKLLQ